MASSNKDIRVSKINVNDVGHDIDAKYWCGKTLGEITPGDLGLSPVLTYCGITTTKLEDGSDANPVIIDGGEHTAIAGCVVFYDNAEFVFNGYKWELLGEEHTYKVIQKPVSSPSANGATIEFIDTIAQDANGVITATKKEVRNATKNQKGAVKLVEGDMNGKSYVDGQVPSLNHTHSQYASSNHTHSQYVEDTEMVIVKGGAENSAILAGEYEGYSNEAISQVSVAVGAASTSGLKGWYYDAITFDDTNKVYKIYIKYQNKIANGTGITTTNNTTTQPKTISTSSGSTNSSFSSGYAVGDVISIVNDKKYEDCSTITAINGNVLTVDKLPFAKSDMKTSSVASVIGYEAIDEFSIYCIKRDFNETLKTLTLSKYDQGDVDFGGGSLSEGVQTYAVNIGAHAEGAQTVAKGQYSHAEGIRTIANYASHAEGAETIASGSRCHAEGYKNEASGDFSHVEGDNNVASGVSSHAEGYNTRATNNHSHAEGGSTNATGKQSHAEGWSTTASGLHSHAEGGYTIASAWNSHAGGNYSEAGGNNSFAHGDHVNTTNTNEVAFGKYNKSESDTLFSIGNGTDENNRSNILEVKSIENDSEVKYEYFAPSGDITFYYYDDEYDKHKALVASYFDVVGEYARYKVEYITSTTNYTVRNFVGDSLYTTILNIKQSDGFLYLPLDGKPQCEIDKADSDQDYIDLIDHSCRTLYISTDFTEENAISVLDEYDYSVNIVRLQYSEHKTNNSALFVNGQRVLVEGSVNESKDWSDDISNAKKQAISESNTYTDSKIIITRNTSSTGIIDTGCIYKDKEIKNVAKGCCSVAIGAGVLSKSDGAITLGWSDTKTVPSDSTLSTNDDYLNKWKELTNITDETIGSTTQAGFSASLGNNSVSLGRNNLSVGPQSTAIGMRNLSIGNHAVALGGYNIARGHDSVAMGQGCITNNTGSSSSNRGEFACGRFNKSVSDTQFSLGIGTSATKRKNALEIKTNGKHYIYGVGGYEGTNPNDSNDIATVLSNISKDIDDIKQSNVVEIANNTPEVLCIQRNNDQLAVTASDDRLLDYVSVTQGWEKYATIDLINCGNSTIRKPYTGKMVYCAYREDGTIGGTDLTSAFKSHVSKYIYEQTLSIKFEEYVTIRNTNSIEYAKYKVVSASCTEADSFSGPKSNRSYCYLRANTFKTAGYTGSYVRYETIIVREGDYVYITKEFLDSKIALDPYSNGYCSTVDYYQLFGEDDVSNGNLFVQVKYNISGTVGYPMLGVNIVCDSTYPTTTVDSDLEEIRLGGINYCINQYIVQPFVVQLHRHFDIIVNNIDDTIGDVSDIDIILPPKDSIHLYKPMKFINNYNPNEPNHNFNFKFEDNQSKFVDYEKTDFGYVRKYPYDTPRHTISAMSDGERDISFKITKFNPITSLYWYITDNVSL